MDESLRAENFLLKFAMTHKTLQPLAHLEELGVHRLMTVVTAGAAELIR